MWCHIVLGNDPVRRTMSKYKGINYDYIVVLVRVNYNEDINVIMTVTRGASRMRSSGIFSRQASVFGVHINGCEQDFSSLSC